IAQIAKPFEHETQMVSQQVERMYQGFQYQDRISQMMTLLHDDIERLQLAMTQKQGAPIDPAQWLARLEAGYVMAEQRHQHGGSVGVSGASGSDDTTFF
ncbi:MAG: hypothetical protein COW39_03255, partial [Comamonadaceae bacterium CG17_big_fil_post_rev_8_21_14_2_50_60_13]